MFLPHLRPKTGSLVVGPWPVYGGIVVGSIFERQPLTRLQTADVLACRDGTGLGREFITIAGRGAYYHVAKFAWKDGVPTVVEMIETCGGREIPFDAWLDERDGLIDVFRPENCSRREYNRQGAIRWMRANIVDQPYGWDVIRRFVRQGNWLTCWWNRPCTDPYAAPPATWVCSTAAACADAYGGGVNPVHGLWPGDVQPSEYARANLNRYQFTMEGRRCAS